jgi:hypothetical protein
MEFGEQFQNAQNRYSFLSLRNPLYERDVVKLNAWKPYILSPMPHRCHTALEARS